MSSCPEDVYAVEHPRVLRNRTEQTRWQTEKHANSVLARKLLDIRREPPSAFHAPNMYKSLSCGTVRKACAKGRAPSAMTCTQHCSPSSAWPPAANETVHQLQTRASKKVMAENANLHKKLNETYNKRKDSFLCENGIGTGFDCRQRWARRTALYVPGSAAGKGSDNGVPRTLAVALCSGCGRKAFRNADGKHLTPCVKCGKAWYCSQACAEFDWEAHRNICHYNTTGQWMAAGTRPSGFYWVMNGAEAEARRLLGKGEKQAAAAGGEPRADIQRVLHQQRLRELVAEEAQKLVEKRAEQGLDGPRPCMCQNGRVIGRKWSAEKEVPARKIEVLRTRLASAHL